MSTHRDTHAKILSNNAVSRSKASTKTTSVKSKLTVKSTPKSMTKTKSDRVLSQLQRVHGVSIKQLMSFTGWQAHSQRAVISGLRKRGISIVRSKAKNGRTIYRATRS